jgi:hypothetical protein
MKNSIRFLASLSLAIVCAVIAGAQTNRGGISGTVTDSTGGVIPSAKVVITNVGTNQQINPAATAWPAICSACPTRWRRDRCSSLAAGISNPYDKKNVEKMSEYSANKAELTKVVLESYDFALCALPMLIDIREPAP